MYIIGKARENEALSLHQSLDYDIINEFCQKQVDTSFETIRNSMNRIMLKSKENLAKQNAFKRCCSFKNVGSNF